MPDQNQPTPAATVGNPAPASMLDLCAQIAEGEITIKGRRYRVRALSDTQVQASAAAFPAPVPPVTIPRGRGSAAPPEPDPYDPDFQTASRIYRRRILAAQAVLALDLEHQSRRWGGASFGDAYAVTPERLAWLAGAAEHLRQHTAPALIDAIVAESDRLGSPDRLESEAKNS
jgi:hypothetical protein